MKQNILIPHLNQQFEFDFMKMQFDNDLAFIDGDLRATFLLTPTTPTCYNLVLGIHFNVNDFIDERFDDYIYTGLESLYKIELYDFDLEIKLNYNDRAQLLLIAQSIFPREYKETQTKTTA